MKPLQFLQKNLLSLIKEYLIKVSLPESFKKLNSKATLDTTVITQKYTFENSIHIFDILYFLVGDISWRY